MHTLDIELAFLTHEHQVQALRVTQDKELSAVAKRGLGTLTGGQMLRAWRSSHGPVDPHTTDTATFPAADHACGRLMPAIVVQLKVDALEQVRAVNAPWELGQKMSEYHKGKHAYDDTNRLHETSISLSHLTSRANSRSRMGSRGRTRLPW